MALPYNKTPLSYQDQVTLLLGRGMIVEDHHQAIAFLSHCGYYRFAGYAIPFSVSSPDGTLQDSYRAGINFSTVQRLCTFDSELRKYY